MSSSAPRIHMPQVRVNYEGKPRHIGVELEMNGLSLDKLSATVASFLDLRIEQASRYQHILHGDDEGPWVTELDFRLLKELGEKDQDHLDKDIESLLKLISKPLVPYELISPPLTMQRLPEVQSLIETLRNAGAKGTSESVLNAFSMQLNPEVPSLQPQRITAYLKAFLCLYDWLHHQSSINMTRRLTTYVEPFPQKYAVKVLADDYWPATHHQLIEDYLTDNPTRNRALDMLPLFAYIDDALVHRHTKDPLIVARPAFHYRLPDCEIHIPDWGVHLAWNGWLQVEALANDEARLSDCAKDYMRLAEQPWWQRMLRPGKSQWVNRVERHWIIDLDAM